jgi:16S rRNA (uracil1498-N3)-methyltransferase
LIQLLKQFLLQKTLLPDGRVILSGKDYHYLVRVRRVKTGDALNAVLPDGGLVRLTVISVGEDSLVCGSDGLFAEKSGPEPRQSVSSAPTPIVLLQALPQPAKMDILVRQSTEGGVSAIVPFVSRYSVKPALAASKLERWRRIVREARQQSGSPVATTVEDIRDSLAAVLDYYRQTRAENTVALLLHEKPGAVSGAASDVGTASGAFHRELASPPGLVFIVIGPEGGLSDEETATFVQNGFIMINMGANVLRVETAAAWAIGAVSVILREAAVWKLKE